MFHPADSIAQEIPEARPAVEPFLLLPRNKNFSLGKVRYPAIKDRSAIFFIALMQLFTLAFCGYSVYGAYVVNQIAQYGQITMGTVTSRSITRGKSTSYYLTYTYQAVPGTQAARSYQNKQSVSRGTYDRHPINSRVSVAYLPDDPATSRLGGPDREDGSTLILVPIMGLVVLIPTAFLAHLIKQVFQDREFAQKGHIIGGRLLDVQGVMTGGKNRYFRLDVEYAFLSPQSGREITKRQSTPRNDLKGKKNLPQPGEPVAVLYVDDKHFKML
jgi:hypothetical protein